MPETAALVVALVIELKVVSNDDACTPNVVAGDALLSVTAVTSAPAVIQMFSTLLTFATETVVAVPDST